MMSHVLFLIIEFTSLLIASHHPLLSIAVLKSSGSLVISEINMQKSINLLADFYFGRGFVAVLRRGLVLHFECLQIGQVSLVMDVCCIPTSRGRCVCRFEYFG